MKDLLKELKGRYVRLHYVIPDVGAETISGTISDVRDNVIIIKSPSGITVYLSNIIVYAVEVVK